METLGPASGSDVRGCQEMARAEGRNQDAEGHVLSV